MGLARPIEMVTDHITYPRQSQLPKHQSEAALTIGKQARTLAFGNNIPPVVQAVVKEAIRPRPDSDVPSSTRGTQPQPDITHALVPRVVAGPDHATGYRTVSELSGVVFEY